MVGLTDFSGNSSLLRILPMSDEEKQLLDLLASTIAEIIYKESIENLNEEVFKSSTVPPPE